LRVYFIKIIFSIVAVVGSNANGASVIVGLGDCQSLLKHHAKSGVNYEAGFDVRGKKVKTVDYTGERQSRVQEAVSFDIAIDIAEKYNLTTKGLNAKMMVATLKIKNGKVFLNNHLLSKGDEAELKARCHSIFNVN